jgi:hypothetical protein
MTWVEYYHLSPVILTDVMFDEYNPQCVDVGTVSQRQNAYVIAESRMIEQIGTFLLPTTVTGTFIWPQVPQSIVLPHSFLTSIDRLIIQSFEGECNCDLTANTGCGLIRNGIGYIDARVTEFAATAYCACGGAHSRWFYQAQVTYTAGLPTGTAANDTRLHNALSVVAYEALTQMVEPGLGAGGPGNPGVMGFSTMGYSETFNKESLQKTKLGNSALANYAASLVSHYKKKRALRF